MAVPFKQVQLKAIMKLSISEACKQLPALVRKVRRDAGARVEIYGSRRGRRGATDEELTKAVARSF